MSRLPLASLGLLFALGACAELQGTGAGPVTAAGGACPADAHQDWVGQRVDVLNNVDLPEGTRVLFPTTPATMDYRSDRLNITIDKSEFISRVYCG